jgi:ribosome-binding factor A
MSRRIERLNDLIQEEISELIRRQTKDPRLDCFLTVTRVDTSPDLRHAKIYISIMGSDEEKKNAMGIPLQRAQGAPFTSPHSPTYLSHGRFH